MKHNASGDHYAYDPLSRLKQVSGLVSDAYIYDNAGNRLTDSKYRYTYDTVNRLIKKEGAERLTQAKGAMPIAILKGAYTSGQEILLKQGPPQTATSDALH